MYLVIDENDNCRTEERVFKESGEKKQVLQIQVEVPGQGIAWCDVMGVDEEGIFTSAMAVQVEDSGAGTAILVYGGLWGIRFRKPGTFDDWALTQKNQWGEPFKVLDASGEDIRYR